MIFSNQMRWQVNAMKKIESRSIQRQKGSALAVSLVILLVLTILGVNSMSSLVLEERMAGHTRQSMVASQSAQVALRVAENFINTTVTSTAQLTQFRNNTAGLYSPHTGLPLLPVAFDVAVDANWTSQNSVSVPLQNVNPTGAKANLVGRGPQYIIEYLGKTGEVLLNPNEPVIDPSPHAFRITAVGWGEDINARFLVQSTFSKEL
jgi:type IV pilus assembly protein PilX